MKVVILHLSDIHFFNAEDKAITRLPQIVATVRALEHKFDTCLVLISGDIAFSGDKSQYDLGARFFERLTSELQRIQPGLFVGCTAVPGNHDCDFTLMADDVHHAVVNSISPKMEKLKGADGIVKELLSLQDNFFSFESELTGSAIRPPEKRLFYTTRFSNADAQIQVNCYNTALLSRLPEIQGTVLFPSHMVSDSELGGTDSNLVISMFHHPYGWFDAENAIGFERLIERSSDVVLTGHEHSEKYTHVTGINGDEVNYAKGAVLQDSSGDRSGFNLIYIDLETRKQKIIQYKWKGKKYERAAQSALVDFIRNKLLRAGVFATSAELAAELEDTGAGFDHPRRDHLRLKDIFIFPDLMDKTFEFNDKGNPVNLKTISGQEILSYISEHQRVMITGADLSGKSTLAKIVFSELKDVVPILIKGQDLDGPDLSQFTRSISRVFSRQYSHNALEAFRQLEKSGRALIIDDFHKSKFRNKAARERLIKVVCEQFGTVVIFVDEVFQMQELANRTGFNDLLKTFRNTSIKELGNVLRAQLIKKWVKLGQENTVDDRDLAITVKNYADIVTNALGKNILPSCPLIILAILQAWEANQFHDMQAGSYGHIYEELIIRALRKVSEEPEDIDTKYTYIARLAYYAFENKKKTLTERQVREVYKEYARLYSINFSLGRMLKELERARIIKVTEGNYQFKYKYVYYYFVARYFKETIAVPEEAVALRQRLLDMADRIHNEDYANILAFYVYRTKDQEVINRLVSNAGKIFDEYPACDFDTHVAFLNKLLTSLPNFELPPPNVEEAQKKHFQKLDEESEGAPARVEADTETYADLPYSRTLEVFLKIDMALKTLQVIGQILRNSPGSLRANVKLEITKQGYNLGLRLLKAVLGFAETNLESVRELHDRLILERRDVKSDWELSKLADSATVNVSQSIAFGIVKRVSHSLGHEKLAEIYAQILRDHESNANKLIDLSIKLDHCHAIPEQEIEALRKLFRENIFAFAVLRDLIANHLYLFPVEESTRQRLVHAFEFRTADPKMLTGRDRKSRR